MKTNSSVPPSWANYKAQDEDGQWWWYAEEPVICTDIDGWVSEGRMEADGPVEYRKKCWTHTLKILLNFQ